MWSFDKIRNILTLRFVIYMRNTNNDSRSLHVMCIYMNNFAPRTLIDTIYHILFVDTFFFFV